MLWRSVLAVGVVGAVIVGCRSYGDGYGCGAAAAGCGSGPAPGAHAQAAATHHRSSVSQPAHVPPAARMPAVPR